MIFCKKKEVAELMLPSDWGDLNLTPRGVKIYYKLWNKTIIQFNIKMGEAITDKSDIVPFVNFKPQFNYSKVEDDVAARAGVRDAMEYIKVWYKVGSYDDFGLNPNGEYDGFLVPKGGGVKLKSQTKWSVEHQINYH